MKMILSHIRASIVLLLLFTILLGGVYPLFITAFSQLLFANKSQGSLIISDKKIIGSQLLGQQFTGEGYFWGRPSATQPAYNAAASGGSNLSPANPVLIGQINERIAALKKADQKNTQLVPIDLVTASASGLDPHISEDAAFYQLSRVARARNLPEIEVLQLINENTDRDIWVFFGTPRVHVLNLNIALDKVTKAKPKEKR